MSAGEVLALFVVLVLVVVGVGAWIDRDRDLDAPIVSPDPLPGLLPDAAVRAWLVRDARVLHDVLGLGTVVDDVPTHAPGGGTGLFVLVRFDTLSEPRWIRPRELDPVTPDDERALRRIADRIALRTAALLDGESTLYPRECTPGPDGVVGCYWHGSQCGKRAPWHDEESFCCSSCPARGGAL